MLNILALYRGKTLSNVTTIAATSDPRLVRDFARRMLVAQKDNTDDASLQAILEGKRKALTAILNESDAIAEESGKQK